MSALIKQAYVAGAEEAIANQWNDVNYELPNRCTVVFVLRGIGSIPETAFFKKDGTFTEQVGVKSEAVTHWMFIPEMPKIDKRERFNQICDSYRRMRAGAKDDEDLKNRINAFRSGKSDW